MPRPRLKTEDSRLKCVTRGRLPKRAGSDAPRARVLPSFSLRPSAFSLALTVLALLAGHSSASADDGRFGQGLNTNTATVLVEHDPAFSQWPLNLGVWVKLTNASHYSILIASQTKASRAHWELFTLNGRLAFYAPGMEPDHVRSQANLGDGRWHFVAASLQPDGVRLAVDGAVVAQQAVQRPTDLPARQEGLAIGSLVEENVLGSSAILDDLRLRQGTFDITTVPQGPPRPDATTLVLLSFEGDKKQILVDAAAPKRQVDLRPAIARRPTTVSLPTIVAPTIENTREVREALLSVVSGMQFNTLSPDTCDYRPAVLAHWRTWSKPSDVFQWNRKLARPDGRIYDEHSLYWDDDFDVLSTTLRRTRALLDLREKACPESIPAGFADDLARLSIADRENRSDSPAECWARREGLYYAACALRRTLILSDPKLAFDRLVFLSRGTWAGTRLTTQRNTDQLGGHFATQNFGFITKPGGGLWIASDWKTRPRLTEPLAEAVVENGPSKGQRLHGSVHSLELSFDAKQLLFAHNFSTENSWTWTDQTTWKIFRINADGTSLVQLTTGPFNDFDACFLPDGNIAFVSERRGGFIRCFRGLHVPTYVLHRMRPDGSAIHPISFYETSEWNPSVNREGRLVYARWDYTDREDCLGSTFWVCDPDGCNPRSPHGNYPYPWSTRADASGYREGPGRAIMSEMGIRAIPGSHKYLCTVAPHHGEHYGAIGVIDLRRPDGGSGIDQLEIVTPYQPFPESRCSDRSNYQYGTPWPLSEDLFLSTSWEDLVVLDRFGNEELILARTEVLRAKDDPAMRLCDPIPLAPRPTPPVVRERSQAWPDLPSPESSPARISVVDVRNSDLPLPEGVEIRWVRVVQNFLKEDPAMDLPRIGYGDENTPRMSLGVVPVEPDGSVHFLAPPNKELMFQLLDEDYRAVHSMRSVAFVHRGEHLSCQGCHESTRHSSLPLASPPLALRREPSLPVAEPTGREPLVYARHIRPILGKADLPCLKGLDVSDHETLRNVAFHLAGGFRGAIMKPEVGGSRTIPGHYGARVSVLGQQAHTAWLEGRLSDHDYRSLTLWLDCHSPRLGAYHGEQLQTSGVLVWPQTDVAPSDPLGLQGSQGENTLKRIMATAAQFHPSNAAAPTRWRAEEVAATSPSQ